MDLARLPVEVDAGATQEIVFNTTQALCRKHGLTAYDAPTSKSPFVGRTRWQPLMTI